MRTILPLSESKFYDLDPKFWLPDNEEGCIDLVLTAPPDYMLDETAEYYEETSYKWSSFEDYMIDMVTL